MMVRKLTIVVVIKLTIPMNDTIMYKILIKMRDNNINVAKIFPNRKFAFQHFAEVCSSLPQVILHTSKSYIRRNKLLLPNKREIFLEANLCF